MCHKMPNLKFSENFENVNLVRTSSSLPNDSIIEEFDSCRCIYNPSAEKQGAKNMKASRLIDDLREAKCFTYRRRDTS